MNRFLKLTSCLSIGLLMGGSDVFAKESAEFTIFSEGERLQVVNEVLQTGDASIVDGDHFVVVACQYLAEKGLQWGEDVRVVNMSRGQFTMIKNRGQWKAFSCVREIQPPLITQGREVLLLSRYSGEGNYHTATYSFRYRVQGNLDATLGNYEILYEARPDFQDRFVVNITPDDHSHIYELDAGTYAEAKEVANDILSHRSTGRIYDNIPVVKGRYYLAVNSDSAGQIATLFKVKEQIPHRAIIISEIEVLRDSAKKAVGTNK